MARKKRLLPNTLIKFRFQILQRRATHLEPAHRDIDMFYNLNSQIQKTSDFCYNRTGSFAFQTLTNVRCILLELQQTLNKTSWQRLL